MQRRSSQRKRAIDRTDADHFGDAGKIGCPAHQVGGPMRVERGRCLCRLRLTHAANRRKRPRRGFAAGFAPRGHARVRRHRLVHRPGRVLRHAGTHRHRHHGPGLARAGKHSQQRQAEAKQREHARARRICRVPHPLSIESPGRKAGTALPGSTPPASGEAGDVPAPRNSITSSRQIPPSQARLGDSSPPTAV
jgi:hypothetical protein